MSPFKKNILFSVTGSISAYKACEIISLLKKKNYDVKVIATESALQFVGKATFEGLTGHQVITHDFQDGEMMAHIQLAKWADLFVIAPATAQTLNSLAQGTGNSILISTYLAYNLKKPLFIAPAMNTQMLFHPTTQKSISQLQSYGVDILETGSGDLACGDVGPGRLLEPQIIANYISNRLENTQKFKILITAGGTKVPIDSVRSITNTSTGKTGSALADYFYNKNYQVDLLLSADGIKPQIGPNIIYYKTYDDLALLMEKMIKSNNYDLIIHAAAVSDFKVQLSTKGKLASGQEQTLILTPTDKLLKKIKSWNKTSKIIGFKLTDTPDQNERHIAVSKVFAQGASLVVHNDLSEIKSNTHVFNLLSATTTIDRLNSATSLAASIENQFNDLIVKESQL